MANIALRNPDAPATQNQLFKIHKLTGEDTRGLRITMQEASNKVAEFDVGHVIPPPDIGMEPFSEAHVTLVEAEQGGGKSCTAVGMVVDAYYQDCINNYLAEKKLNGKAIAYDR